MTISKLAAGAAGALFIALASSAAYAAHSDGGYMCQTFNMAKATPPSTHCITWTKAAAARMRAVNCDPSKMASAAMRAQCAELMASTEQPAPAQAGS
jgi:hypothetical protein